MKAKLFNPSLNLPAYSAMLLLPGIAIALSTPDNNGALFGFAYGLTMAYIGLKLAQFKRISPKNLVHFFGITLLIPGIALAATTGGEFQAFYDFIYNAATGYLGRGLAITGGVFGLAYGIGKGSPLPAVLGIVLAIFGMLGPTIVNALFSSATI